MFAQPIMLSQQASDLLLRYPGLVIVETDDGILLRGVVQSKGKHYHININCPNFPKLKDFKMLLRDGFRVKKFSESTAAIRTKQWTIDTIDQLISNLEALSKANDLDNDCMEAAVNQQKTENAQINNANDSGALYAEIAALYKPDFYDIKLNSLCTLIHFSKFSVHDQHFLEIELPSLKVRAHSLPDCIKLPEVLSKCGNLTEMIEKFQKFLEELQPFYENLNAIDDLCHVLQPAKPTTKHNFRLFVLRERVFLKLLLADPFAPLPSMSLHIIGPTSEVEQLRRAYSEGLKNWDSELDIQKNLLRIFDLCFFPMPPTENDTDEQNLPFCNICYSYRLKAMNKEDAEFCDVPVVSCDNPQCTLIFHDSCLLQWFRTLTDNVSFLNVPFGDCPFCKAKLSTSFEQLRFKSLI